MKKFFASWAINTLAVLLAAKILRGIHYHENLDLIVASLLLGILNSVLRPVLLFLALPLVIVTLGLFIFVINALLLYFVANLLRPHFYVDSFWDAFWGALLISVISLVLNTLTGTGSSRIHLERRRPTHRGGPDGGGPIIDV